MLILGGVVGAVAVNATISSTPTAYVSPYSCEKTPTFILTVDNSATPNYYAIAGWGTATQSCGNLVYGGPTNAGSVIGTNFTSVIDNAVVALGTAGGTIAIEPGNYNFASNSKYAIPIPNTVNHADYVFQGEGGYENTVLNFSGSANTRIMGSPYASPSTQLTQVSLTLNNMKIQVAVVNYAARALDFTIIPILYISNVYLIIKSPGASATAASVGLEKAQHFGHQSTITNLLISGFGTDMLWNDDHLVCTECEFDAILKVGLQLGNQTSTGSTDDTFINPHFFTDNAAAPSGTATYVQYNFTGGARNQANFIDSTSEGGAGGNPKWQFDFTNAQNSWLLVTGGNWFPGGTVSPTLVKYITTGRMDALGFRNYGLITSALATPFCNAGSSVFDMGPDCAAALPTSATRYQASLMSYYVTVSGGTVSAISITTPNGNVVATLGTSCQGYYLAQGFAITVTYSVNPTVTVFQAAN